MSTVTAERNTAELSRDSVRALHDTFIARITYDASSAALQAGKPYLQDDLAAYLLAAARKRTPVSKTKLLALAASDSDTITAATNDLQAGKYFDRAQQDKLDTATAARVQHDVLDAVFGDQDRIYLKTQYPEEMSATESSVRVHLKQLGYTVTDYEGGYATDKAGKNTYRIGKLLQDNERVKFLYKRYVDDTTRLKDTMVVISRNPDDIARMSAGRHWGSCMSPHRAEFDAFVHEDIRQGTIVAYLVRGKDPEINDPCTRLLVKPYTDAVPNLRPVAPLPPLKPAQTIRTQGPIKGLFNTLFGRHEAPAPQATTPQPAQPNIAFVPEGTMHGCNSPELRHTVDLFVAEFLNKNAPDGAYYLSPQLYCDSNSSREYSKQGDLLRPIKGYDANHLAFGA